MRTTFDGVPVEVCGGGERHFPMAAWLIAALWKEGRDNLQGVVIRSDSIVLQTATFDPPMLEAVITLLVGRFDYCPRLSMPCRTDGALWAGVESGPVLRKHRARLVRPPIRETVLGTRRSRGISERSAQSR